jgi:hypothetical protein
MSAATPDHPVVRVYVTEREVRRRRVRRRRLVMLGIAAAVVVLAAAGGVWALAGGGGAPSSGPDATAGTAVSTAATPTGSAAPSSSPTPSPSTSPRVIEIGWVGDTTPGSKYGTPPNGGRSLFGSMRPLLSKPDLMMANLEGTYSTAGPSKCDGEPAGVCYAFQAPPSYAKALAWSGIDLVNVANNHSNDYLTRGFQQTQQALKKAGVAYAGLPHTVTIEKVHGVRVAVMGVSPYSWSAPLNDIPAAAKLVRRAAAEADVVVVLMHAGAEGADKIHTPTGTEYAFGEDRGNVRAFAHAVIDAGADLVFGSGPHVIRGIERYKNHLIAYSLGNFAGWHNFGLGGNLSLSGLLTVKIDKTGRILGGRWTSLYVAPPGVPAVDGSNRSAKLVSSLSSTDFAHTYRLDAKGDFVVK